MKETNMKNIRKAVAALGLISLVACGAGALATATAVTNGAGVACEVVLQATDPALASVCTTAVDVEQAIQALIAAHVTTDAGKAVAGTAPYKPSAAEIRAYLLAHGAAAVKH